MPLAALHFVTEARHFPDDTGNLGFCRAQRFERPCQPFGFGDCVLALGPRLGKVQRQCVKLSPTGDFIKLNLQRFGRRLQLLLLIADGFYRRRNVRVALQGAFERLLILLPLKQDALYSVVLRHRLPPESKAPPFGSAVIAAVPSKRCRRRLCRRSDR